MGEGDLTHRAHRADAPGDGRPHFRFLFSGLGLFESLDDLLAGMAALGTVGIGLNPHPFQPFQLLQPGLFQFVEFIAHKIVP
jgi:hypothetical protein